MKSLIRISFALLALTWNVAHAQTRDTKQYATLEIQPINNASSYPIEPKVLQSLFDEITKNIQKRKLFKQIVSPAQGAASQPPVLTLKVTVTEFEPGSRAVRYLSGPFSGAGAGAMKVVFFLVDKESAEVVRTLTSHGSARAGLFGGGQSKLWKGTAKRIAEMLEQELRTPK